MAVIVKADIKIDVDDNLQVDLSDTELNKAIIKTLTDMSNRGLLVGTDSTQTLTLGDTTLNYPTGFRTSINITLTDSSGSAKVPLIKFLGGHKEYREAVEFDASNGLPEFFSLFNDKIYIHKSAGESYTTLIEYRKNHAKDADNIEFTTEFENLMFAGATFWHAAKLMRTRAISFWASIYADQMRFAILNRNTQPSVIRS